MRSLRGRLTLGVALVLAVVLLAAGAVASHYVGSSERDGSRRPPRAHRRALARDRAGGRQRRAPRQRQAPGCGALRHGQLPAPHAGREGPPRRRAPRRPSARACGAGLQTFESGGQRYRAYVTTLRDPGLGGLARLEVVTSLASLEDRQAQLDRRLLALGLLALRRGERRRLAHGRSRPATAAAAAQGGFERRRGRGPRPPRAPGRPDRAALAGGELQRDARPPGALARPTASAPWRPRGASPPTPATSCARR